MNPGCFLFNTLKYQVKTGPIIFKSFSAPTDQDYRHIIEAFKIHTRSVHMMVDTFSHYNHFLNYNYKYSSTFQAPWRVLRYALFEIPFYLKEGF